MILTSCVKIPAKTVNVDYSCDRYYSLQDAGVSKSDYKNIDIIRTSPNLKVTMDKFLGYAAVNEKQFAECLK
jgi:hypothetical protein